MKKIVLFLFTLFFLNSLLFAQNYNSNVEFKKRGRVSLVDTLLFDFKEKGKVHWQIDLKDKHNDFLSHVPPAFGKINKGKKSGYKLKEIKKDTIFVVTNKKKGIDGRFFCVKLDSAKIIFYAEGTFKPKDLLTRTALFITSGFSKISMRSRAYLTLYSNGQLRFYLETDIPLAVKIKRAITPDKDEVLELAKLTLKEILYPTGID